MKARTYAILAMAAAVSFAMPACKKQPPKTIKLFPVDSLDGIKAKSGVSIDEEESYDGNASLKIVADGPVTVPLYETGDLDVENAKLIYAAKIKTKGLIGKAYLEMWCIFPDKGQYFSRALNQTFSGDTGWKKTETPFFLKEGQNPSNVLLNLVIDGKGTVWIDEIRLSKTGL